MYMLYIDVEVKLEPPDEGTIICEGKLKLQLSLQKKNYHCPARLYGSRFISSTYCSASCIVASLFGLCDSGWFTMSNLKLQAAGVHNTIDSICILLACIQGGWTPAYLLFCISFSSKHELSCLHN